MTKLTDECKLVCGCYAVLTPSGWRITATSFLCTHKQFDTVYVPSTKKKDA